MQAALDLLANGVESVLTTDGFRRYLAAMSRFHHYSANNVALIISQRPDATHVAGESRWRTLGRRVTSGESGITIIAPVLRTQRDPVSGAERKILTGFTPAIVYDIRQTSGAPLPEPPRPVDLDDETDAARATILFEQTRTWLADQGVSVRRGPIPGGPAIKGEYLPSQRTIRINWALGEVQAAKTLVHEAAHVVANHRVWDVGADVETVAEASAFVVCQHVGLETREYSFPYVARWALDRTVLARNLSQIQATSHTLIQGITQVPHMRVPSDAW